MKTMAVGPFEPAEFWVTGGLCTEARHLADCPVLFCKSSGDAVCREILESPATDCLKAMAAAASVELPEADERFEKCSQVEEKKLEAVKTQKGAQMAIATYAERCTETRDLQIARPEVFADPELSASN